MARAWAALCAALALVACSRNEPFQADTWKQTPEVERHVFVDDLMARELLMGRTAEEVEDLLGPPSPGASQTRISYVVGPGARFSFDAITILDVTIGSDRKVEKVSVRGD